ncbi:Glycosyl transferase family 2 [Chitinophaga jiangningensis]|uniref:Glycosyl transferase family 2 n=1 Tax=Chitinophaga jiangningensis TaxID=1419482 RepID=A0A1M7IT37_9BACT|nr:glycosyltransferase family 2 protein [Chitinophaga jiangningensis]SHM43497.1 Glycosyl transferase family 2 [Chitinophaga jiangningensis]
MTITLFTITRNTAHRLEEWIAFHSSIGIDEIIIYLDHPTDNSIQLLQKLQHQYNITYKVLPPDGAYLDGRFGSEYIKWLQEHGNPLENAPHIKRQFNAIKTILSSLKVKYEGQNHWTAFIDVDEFLVPQKTTKIKEIIEKYQRFYSRIVAFDYRFELPKDIFIPFIEQCTIRRPVTQMTEHWPTRKSIIRTTYHTEIKCLHDLDQSPYLIIDDELKLYHYREQASFPADTYFIEDRRALILKQQLT